VFIGPDAVSTTARGSRTNAAGRYTFTAVPTGAMTVSVRLVGFAPKAARRGQRRRKHHRRFRTRSARRNSVRS
jgi:hypothetical protein